MSNFWGAVQMEFPFSDDLFLSLGLPFADIVKYLAHIV